MVAKHFQGVCMLCSTPHVDQLIIFQSSPPQKKRHEFLQEKALGLFGGSQKKTFKNSMPQKRPRSVPWN